METVRGYMTRLRGYLSVPQELFERADDAVQELKEIGVDVYGFDGFERRRSFFFKDFRGFFINGESRVAFDDRNVIRLFYGTDDLNKIERDYGAPFITYDVSSGDEIWPMDSVKSLKNYHSKRFSFSCGAKSRVAQKFMERFFDWRSARVKLNLITVMNRSSDYRNSAFRQAEPGVLVFESFDDDGLVKRVQSELKDYYIGKEDAKIERLYPL